MVLVNSSIFRTPYLKNWSYKPYPAVMRGFLIGFYSKNFYFLDSFIKSFFIRASSKFNFFVSHFLFRKLVNSFILEIFIYDPSFYATFDSLKGHKSYYVIRRSLFIKFFLLKSYFSSLYPVANSLKKDLINFFSFPFSVKFRLSHLTNFSASAISTYMVQRLGSGVSLGEAIKPVLKNFKKRRGKILALKGIKVVCSGRFTRKQRASLSFYSAGSIPLSSYAAKVDYTQSHVRLKYGICNIKVWVSFRV